MLQGNAKGSALLNAIVVAGIIAGISGIIMTQTKTTNESSRAPRIRSAMAVMQARVQTLASQPSSYNCTGVSTDFSNCSLVPGLFDFTDPIIGAQCPAGKPNCGVAVSAAAIDKSAGAYLTFSATISYEGTETPIAPIKVNIKIPGDVLASRTVGYICQDPKPLFGGYDKKTGQIICKAFPTTCDAPGGNLTSQGTFIAGLDPLTMNPLCNQLGAPIACPANQYLSKYVWSGKAYVTACAPRVEPFTAMGYGVPPTVIVGYVTDPPHYSATTTTTLGSPPPGDCGWTSVGSQGGQDPGGQCTGCPSGPGTSCEVDRAEDNPCTTANAGAPLHHYRCQTDPYTSTWSTDDYICSCTPPPPTTTTLGAPPTTMPVTAWNCSDGFATAAPCNSSITIVDDGNLSPSNPGAASLLVYTVGGNPATKCQCSSGTLTVVSCSGGDRYIVCQGATPPPLACPWPGGASVPKSCAPAYGSPAPGGWSCLGPPAAFYPCP